MRVKEVCSYKWGVEFPRCPRCGTTMEREYQHFYDRCGQRLNWNRFDDCEMRHIGWNETEDESDADCKQVDDGDQEDIIRQTESHGSPWLQYITSSQINQPCGGNYLRNFSK